MPGRSKSWHQHIRVRRESARTSFGTTVADGRLKGIPPGINSIPINQIPAQGWKLLRGDLPLPAAVLLESALRQNSYWMQRFLEQSGALLCPHGKTTMSPELFRRQLSDGAWGITVSTVQQLYVARRHGFKRIFMANQLIGRVEARYTLNEIAMDPEFDFFCLVDSIDGVNRIAEIAREGPAKRPLQVLLEGGYVGGRSGCRDLEEALEVARRVKLAEPYLVLRGVEGYEGTLQTMQSCDTVQRVRDFTQFLTALAEAFANENLYGPGPILLSAGGTAFFDLVAQTFAATSLAGRQKVILRSGCYLTLDSGIYQELHKELRKRLPSPSHFPSSPISALEIWTYVQSVPEPNLAILTAGRRDCGHDAGLPVPLKRFRPAQDDAPVRLNGGYRLTELNDQHAYMHISVPESLRVGDMIALGISHPCTTFDKWKIIYLVNDDYTVMSAIETFF